MTAVDPRTIAVNAAAWMLDHGWYAYRDGSQYVFVSPDRDRIIVDRHGIHHDAMDIVVDTGGVRPTWSDMARAVDILAAYALLPYHLQTGVQASGTYWRGELAKAEEANKLLDRQLRDTVQQLADLTATAGKVAAEQEAEIARLKGLAGEQHETGTVVHLPVPERSAA